MKQEIKKPKDYKKGGLDNLKSYFIKGIPQLLCLLAIVVWLASSVFVSIKDIFTGFEHSWLSYSFITSIITVGYLITFNFITKKLSGTKPKKKKPCTKCGKNTTKK